jgi:hypothetical protein
MDLVDKDGYLKIPLFHGTSSIFINSIVKNGLGSPIPKTQYSIELFRKLCDVHNNSQWQSIWWRDNSYIWESMLNQKVNRYVNFRYGGTYLSPSKENASSYALNNSYGSELLSSIIDSIQALETFNLDVSHELIPKNHFIRRIMLQQHRPVLISLKKMKVSDLMTEKNLSVTELLNQMKENAEKYPSIQDALWNQSNFHCLSIIPVSYNNFEYLT